jgi:hypothetical protein
MVADNRLVTLVYQSCRRATDALSPKKRLSFVASPDTQTLRHPFQMKTENGVERALS